MNWNEEKEKFEETGPWTWIFLAFLFLWCPPIAAVCGWIAFGKANGWGMK